jgi:hypothetical protein
MHRANIVDEKGICAKQAVVLLAGGQLLAGHRRPGCSADSMHTLAHSVIHAQGEHCRRQRRMYEACSWPGQLQVASLLPGTRFRLQRRPGGSRRKVACTTGIILQMATREDEGRMFEVCSWSDADDSLAQGMWRKQSTEDALCLHSSWNGTALANH